MAIKTLLVVSKENLKKHAGREVDDYLEVSTILAPEDMPAAANEIRNRIRMLIVQADKEGGKPEREVRVEFDASPPYRVILASLADIMAQEEKLVVHLPDDFKMQKREDKVNLV
jgi:hypothetical protein